jgi:Fasciclin domain
MHGLLSAVQVIKTHVVSGVITAADITSASSPVTVKSLSGDYLVAQMNGSDVTVAVFGSDAAPATVVTPDVDACSGVIHVIDAVLVPAPCESVLDALMKNPMLSSLVDAAASVRVCLSPRGMNAAAISLLLGYMSTLLHC